MALLSFANRARFIRIAPSVSICCALLLVTLVCIWGLSSDLGRRYDAVYETAINESRSHAERSAGRIEMELDEGKKIEDYGRASLPGWLRNHWQHAIQGKPNQLYAVVTDRENRVLSHSAFAASSGRTSDIEPALAGDDSQSHDRLRNDWSLQPLPNHGPGVHRTNDQALTHGADAIDIIVPIEFDSEVVGYYHAGIQHDWLESQVENAQRNAIRGWLWIIASIALIVLVSSVSLYRLGTHTIRLEQALSLAETRRLADLSRLIVGMAHELRNPLNAVRLNLFTSEKLIRGDSRMPQEDAVAMIRESVSEVERVEDLIGQLLGYARIETQERPWIYVDAEIASTIQFMRQVHNHHKITIAFENQCANLEIRMDRKHLRQILLNLLQNAQQSMSQGGRILVRLSHLEDRAIISIDDSGPGMAADQFDRIFEPFYSTRDAGVGLGLAVVRSLVEAAEGTVTCQHSTQLAGMNFSIQLPSRLLPLQTETNRENLPNHEYDTVHSGR